MPLPRKPALTIGALGALLLVPEFVPAMLGYRVFDWTAAPRVTEFRTSAPAAEPEPPPKPKSKQGPATRPLIDEAGHLGRFFDALYDVERKRPGAVARVLHYGDSPTTGDLITADVRELFQKEFGDAGHGFVLAAKPWAWYGHRGVTAIRASGWKMEPANLAELRDGQYGLGAVSFRGWAGAASYITMRDASHTSVDVYYYSQPEGGTFTVAAGGVEIGTIDTMSPVATSSFRTLDVQGGFRELSLRVTGGHVRLYGVRLGKEPPGVEYSSLGVNGAAITLVSKSLDETHWADQLRHTRPNLVVINYGTNESAFPAYVEAVVEKELTRTIQRVKAATPEASILVMSPMDRGDRLPTGEIGTIPAMARLVQIEQKTARANGVAFFNTFEAMGGAGTMGRWYTATPRLVGADLIHPLPAGAKRVGNLLYRALQDAYRHHKLGKAVGGSNGA
ncbi:MAG: hypothetical protein FJW30_09180 [Acidobacteria bacterium]|nr:hypothetical protein [Acidobacteriota bacterium]